MIGRDPSQADAQRRRIVARTAHLAELAREPMGGAAPIVFLVGCGKTKATQPAAARDMYTSPLFRKSLALAEAIADRVFVVSAAKGLLALDELVTPYESTLRSFSASDRSTWGRLIARELEASLGRGAGRWRVVILAGTTYATPIAAALKEERTRWLPPLEPLRGLAIGDRLAFLNNALVKASRSGLAGAVDLRRSA